MPNKQITDAAVELALGGWHRALIDAPDEPVDARRRRCMRAALEAALSAQDGAVGVKAERWTRDTKFGQALEALREIAEDEDAHAPRAAEHRDFARSTLQSITPDGGYNAKSVAAALTSPSPAQEAGAEAVERPSLPKSAKWCQPGDKQSEQHYLVRFDDRDRGEAVFTDWTEARDYYVRATLSWNCWLFAAVPVSELASPPLERGGEWTDVASKIAADAFKHMPRYGWGEHTTREVYAAIQTAALEALRALKYARRALQEGDGG